MIAFLDRLLGETPAPPLMFDWPKQRKTLKFELGGGKRGAGNYSDEYNG